MLLAGCTASEKVALRPDRGPSGGDAGESERSPHPAVRSPDRPPPAAALGTTDRVESTHIRRSPWTFRGERGHVFHTPHYRLYTTATSPWMREYAARFCEDALERYRTALADLPAPDRPLDVYLFARRSQWQSHTRDLMKDHAGLYLNLGRGGYATRGTAVLYDIGFDDTFAILAHEGWHQYTQVAFQHPLPTWLEEGIATYMEGRIQRAGQEAQFDPWVNQQRLEALSRAAGRKPEQLIPLAQLVDRNPQFFLEQENSKLLTYYAQVWALTLFLVEGEGGRYREKLAAVLEDAAAGRLASTIAMSPHITADERRKEWATSIHGLGVILAYLNHDFGEFAKQYKAFIEEVVRNQGRI